MRVLLCLTAVCLLFSGALSAPFEISLERKAPLQADPEWLAKMAAEMEGASGVPKKAMCPFRELANRIGQNGVEKARRTAKFHSFADTFLYGKISFGTPPQEFTVIFDSTMFVKLGMPTTFLLDERACEKGKGLYCETARTFDPRKSSTFSSILSLKNYTLAKDVISLGGVQAEGKFLLLNGNKFDQFNVIYENAPKDALPGLDGIFSLAFAGPLSPISSGMEYLLKNERKKVASVYLEPTSKLDFYNVQRGSITVGALNNKDCVGGDFAWNWIPKPFFASRWQIPLQKVEYGDQLIKGGPAFFSTFHTFIFAPREALEPLLKLVKPIKQEIQGKEPKDVAVECDRSQLPDISFTFNEHTYTMTPEQYVLDVVLDPKDPSKNICHLMIRPTPHDGGMPDIPPLVHKDAWFFGQLFFAQFCVAFDYTPNHQKIGLAMHRH